MPFNFHLWGRACQRVSHKPAQRAIPVALNLQSRRLKRLLELSHELSNNLGLVAAWLELPSRSSANLEERMLVVTDLASRGRRTLENLMRELQEIDRNGQSG